jgi:hypothetical protein
MIAPYVRIALTFASLAGEPRLILLHGPEETQILINPLQITRLQRARPPGHHKKLLTVEATCIVHFADGKYLSVREPCDEVRKMIEERP